MTFKILDDKTDDLVHVHGCEIQLHGSLGEMSEIEQVANQARQCFHIAPNQCHGSLREVGLRIVRE